MSQRPSAWCFLLLVGVGTATSGVLPAIARAQEDFTKKRVVLTVPGMDKVVVKRGLEYTAADKTALPLDVYAPAGLGQAEPLPVVILIHGGPIDAQMLPHEWGQYQSYGQILAASGLVAVAFKHRLYGAADYPRAAGDVAALLEHVRSQGSALGIDGDRIALWAFSGGGPLLSFALRTPLPYVRCVVSYYALLDFEGGPPVYKMVPPELTPLQQLRQAAGPLPPILIARAGEDDAWSNAAVDAFVTAAHTKKVTLDLLTFPAGHHGFDVFDDQERSREIIRATLAFLKAHLAR
jgi:acetyl esterase/lipase